MKINPIIQIWEIIVVKLFFNIDLIFVFIYLLVINIEANKRVYLVLSEIFGLIFDQ